MAKPPIVCILDKVKEGVFSEEQGRKLIRQIETTQTHVPDEVAAGRLVMDRFERSLRAQAKQAELLERQSDQFVKDLDEMGDISPARFNEMIKEYMGTQFAMRKVAAEDSVMSVAKAPLVKHGISNRNLGDVDRIELAETYFGKTAKTRGFNDVVKGVQEAHNYLRRTLRSVGVDIADLKPGQSPVKIRPGSLAITSEKQFTQDFTRLDTTYLIDNLPFYDEIGSVTKLAELVYRGISGGPRLLQRHLKDEGYSFSAEALLSRFNAAAVVKDVDSYRYFSKVYGNGQADILVDLAESARTNSELIARSEVFGDADKFASHIRETARERGLLTNRSERTIRRYSDYVAGRTIDNSDIATSVEIGRFTFIPSKALGFFQGLSSTVANFGGMLSAIFLDPASKAATARKLGFKSGISNGFVASLFDVNRVTKETKAEMAVMNVLMKAWTDELLSTSRYLADGAGSKAADTYSRFISKWTGLEHLTNGNRKVGLKAASIQIANWKGLKFSELKPETQRHMRLIGITKDDWKEISEFAWKEVDGVKQASPWQLQEAGKEGLARKLSAFYNYVAENGTPMQGVARDEALRRYLSSVDNNVGKFLIRSAFTFSGPIGSIYENFLRPALTDKKSLATFAAFAAYSQLGGTLQEIATAYLKGETVNFEDPKLYLDGFVRGGAASILGDALPMAYNDYLTLDRFISNRVAGITFGTYLQLGEALYKAGKTLAEGKPGSGQRLGLDLIDLSKKYLPTNTIYTKGISERFLIRELRKAVGGMEFTKKELAKQRRMISEGVEYWLK